jgi:ubiquinone/menaquinone biosynthesis C-methylase UbiE
MYAHETIEYNRRGWNAISAQYQASTRISIDDVHYGPLAPGERELRLLGDVAGKRVIEVGCGGGQNAVALTRWGATCVGVDPSPAQLAHARQLALAHGLEIQFSAAVAEDLGAFPDDSFDITISSYAFDYVTDLRLAYGEAWRVLKPGGLFVFCLSHPWFQAVGWHLAGDPDEPEIGDYAAWPAVEEWDWTYGDDTSTSVSGSMRGHLRTVAQIVNDLLEAGFALERLVEQSMEDVAQATPEELARLPYVDRHDPSPREYAVMRKLPRTLVIRARKKMRAQDQT